MKILVTGGAGYIGSVTTELLLDVGHDVTIFDNLGRGHREALDPRATFIEGDLVDRAAISAAVKQSAPDAVMHFAAFALVGESMDNPTMYFRNNVIGGINLAEAMVEHDVRKIVFSSTCATYGQPDTVPITEETPQCPQNPYGESKLMFEKILSWHQQIDGLQPVFLRYFNACGATDKYGEDHDPETHLIPLILRVALGQRESIKIFGDDYDTPDGTCLRDYIHISDLAQAHRLSLEKDVSGPFNLGTGSGNSVLEVIEACRKVTGHAIPAERVARRPGDPARLVASAEKANQQLGWKPVNADLHTIVESAWKWHQRYPNGYAS
jgi:UDP-glucose 4-epimerase